MNANISHFLSFLLVVYNLYSSSLGPPVQRFNINRLRNTMFLEPLLKYSNVI